MLIGGLILLLVGLLLAYLTVGIISTLGIIIAVVGVALLLYAAILMATGRGAP
jgi:hypothetical protein